LRVRRRTQSRADRAVVRDAESRVARTGLAERVILRNADFPGTALEVGGAIHTVLGPFEAATDGHVIDRLRAGTALVTLVEVRIRAVVRRRACAGLTDAVWTLRVLTDLAARLTAVLSAEEPTVADTLAVLTRLTNWTRTLRIAQPGGALARAFARSVAGAEGGGTATVAQFCARHAQSTTACVRVRATWAAEIVATRQTGTAGPTTTGLLRVLADRRRWRWR
jgi:hypothetical protein